MTRRVARVATYCMVSALPGAGGSSPFQSGAGDVFLSIYSGSGGAQSSIPTSFDTSGVEAIIAAYSSDAAVVDLGNQEAPREESSLTVATDALKRVQNLAFAVQDLADLSADPFLRDSYRAVLQGDVEGLVAEIQSIAKNTTYNGERLFDGSSFRVSVGGGRQGSIQAAGIDVEGLALSLSNLDVSTMEGAFEAFDTVQQFSDRLLSSATRSLDNAEDRIATISQSLDFLTGQGGGVAASSAGVGLGYGMNTLSAAQLISAYKPNYGSSAGLVSLFA